MTQQTHITGYIHAMETHVPGVYNFSVWGFDASSSGYIPVSKVEIPLPDVTPESIKARHLVLLKLERDEVYEDARKKATQLDERIAKLESIAYTPTTQENPE